jgi:hypothetical protein
MSVSIDSFVAIPMSRELHDELARRYPNSVASVVEHVVQDFLDRMADYKSEPRQKPSGVHWGSVFLPDGTQLRTKHYGSHNVADIEEGAPWWDGVKYTSIAQMANAMRGGTNNNAWKVLEVKRPQDPAWQLGDRLR